MLKILLDDLDCLSEPVFGADTCAEGSGSSFHVAISRRFYDSGGQYRSCQPGARDRLRSCAKPIHPLTPEGLIAEMRNYHGGHTCVKARRGASGPAVMNSCSYSRVEPFMRSGFESVDSVASLSTPNPRPTGKQHRAPPALAHCVNYYSRYQFEVAADHAPEAYAYRRLPGVEEFDEITRWRPAALLFQKQNSRLCSKITLPKM